MTEPLAWVDIVVAVCALATIFFGIATLREDPSPRRGRLKYIATILLGSVFMLGAVDSIATEALARKLSFTGYIVTLLNHGGKNPSCDIGLADSQGSHTVLTANFSCQPLVVGQLVKATWLAFNARIMSLDILSGANSGNHMNGSGRFEQVIGMALGAFMIYTAIRVRRMNPNANPRRRTRDTPSSIHSGSLE